MISSVNRSSLEKHTIVVIDDDPANCKSIVALCRSMGVDTQAYSAAEEFLAADDQVRANCLIVDIRLERMSGLELMEAVARRGIYLPTIVVSGFVDVPLAVHAMRSGAVTVLEKPYRAQELWDAIRKALSLDAQFRQGQARLADLQRDLTSLSADEARVLERVMAGQTNKAIAQDLGRSLRTIESRRQSIMAKLKVNSHAELIQSVTEMRLLQVRQTAERHADVTPLCEGSSL